MGRRSQTIRNKRKIKVTNYHNDVLDVSEAEKTISKSFSRELKYTIISIFVVTIIMISSAFAIFSSVQKSEHYNTLTVGTLKVDFIDTDDGMGNIINLNGAYPESDEDGLNENPYSFKITNSGSLSAGYTIKILDDEDMINEDGCQDNLLDKAKIRVSVNGNTPITLADTEVSSYVVDTGTLSSMEDKSYSIRIWISNTAGNEVLGKHYHGKILIEAQNSRYNSNVVNAYTYHDGEDDTKCITGEETTCQVTECYKTKTANSCPQGTIIKYAVSNNDEKYFYVIHDDGVTMTLQQRENTIQSSAWYAEGNSNTEGPSAVIPKLEIATARWTNVENQTYSLGETVFSSNKFTGCGISGNSITCSNNIYTLESRTVKARMITVQEVLALGCSTTAGSCPKYMYNYLYQSTLSGGVVDDNSNPSGNHGYWTMSADSTNATNAWNIMNSGSVNSSSITDTSINARAVVVINK